MAEIPVGIWRLRCRECDQEYEVRGMALKPECPFCLSDKAKVLERRMSDQPTKEVPRE
jgi:Zn finger protein HypA/HybF involved in hydrogenase expression